MNTQTLPTKQPKTFLQIRTPVALATALKTAAGRDMSTVSDYVRRAMVRQLRDDGIDPAQGNAAESRRLAVRALGEPGPPGIGDISEKFMANSGDGR